MSGTVIIGDDLLKTAPYPKGMPLCVIYQTRASGVRGEGLLFPMHTVFFSDKIRNEGGLKMNCPYCGKELTEGLIYSSKDIIWFEGPEVKCNGAFLGHQGVFNGCRWEKLSHGFWKGCFIDGHYCDNCGKILFDVKKEQG